MIVNSRGYAIRGQNRYSHKNTYIGRELLMAKYFASGVFGVYVGYIHLSKNYEGKRVRLKVEVDE